MVSKWQNLKAGLEVTTNRGSSSDCHRSDEDMSCDLTYLRSKTL